MAGPENGFDVDAAVRLLEASDARWGRAERDDAARRRPSLERFAHALVFVADELPRWVETVRYQGPGDTLETEVRALGAEALFVVTTPWTAGDGSVPAPSVRVRPLDRLAEVEVDGFEYDDDERPVGCTITLVFSGGAVVRLGASSGADRTALAPLLPALLARVGA